MSRFVICYQGANDPSQQEERSLLSSLASLKQAKVIDQMPGTLLVDGPESEIAKVVKRLRQWSLSPARKVAVQPPHKRLRQPA